MSSWSGPLREEAGSIQTVRVWRFGAPFRCPSPKRVPACGDNSGNTAAWGAVLVVLSDTKFRGGRPQRTTTPEDLPTEASTQPPMNGRGHA